MSAPSTGEVAQGVLAQDCQWRITHVSTAAAEMLGFAGEDLIGMHLLTVLDSPAREDLEAACRRASQEEQAVEVRTLVRGRSVRARVEGGYGGTWIQLARVHESDDLLRMAPLDRQLAQIWEHTPVQFAYLDRSLRFRRVNRAYAEGAGLGLAPDDFVGRRHFDLFPHVGNEDIFRHVAQTGEPYTVCAKPFEHPRRDDGEVTYWDWSLVPILDADGAVEGLLLSLVEVTDRLRSIEELWRSQAQLAASDARFRTMYQAAPIGIELYDARGRLMDANEAILRMFGVDDMETIRGFELLRHPSIPEEMRERVRRGHKAHGVVTLDFDELTQRGLYPSSRTGVAWLDVHIIPAKLGLGPEEGGFFVLVLDVTAQKQAERRLRESLREKESLVREIHHRVKNNLQVVSSLLQLQARHVELPSDREMLQASRDRIHAMAAIHEELYADRDLSCIDLQRYVGRVVRGLVGSYPVEGVRTSVDMGGFCLGIDAAIPLGLIVNELVTNALQHGYPDGCPGVVRVTLREEDGGLLLVVRDDGVGLPEDFDPEAEGSLGLFLARSLCRQIGGRMEIRRNGGAEFRARIPRQHIAREERGP
ncbi:MAG: PAS domain-containing protein [Myxococcota bacterium]